MQSALENDPISILCVDTEAVPAHERFAFWAEEMGAKLGFTRYDSPERATFRQELSILDVGGLSFMRTRGSGVDIFRPVPMRMKEGADYPFYLLVKFNSGFTTNEQLGRSAIIGINDMVLIDSNEAMRLHSRDGADSWIIGLSQPLVTRWLPDARNAVALPLQADKGWSSMLSTYLRALTVGHLQSTGSRFERELIGEHVLSMLSFALAQRGVVHESEAVSARDRQLHARMRKWIRDNYSDPDLSAAKLAGDFNVSVRYVHKVFANAGQGTTFLGVVQHERLEAAVRLLRTASCARMFVAQIAYSCGFADPAYFGLVFRKKFGQSPRAFAALHGATPQMAAALPAHNSNRSPILLG